MFPPLAPTPDDARQRSHWGRLDPGNDLVTQVAPGPAAQRVFPMNGRSPV
jgi:hypothetical protein